MAYHDDASCKNDQKLAPSRPTGSSGFAITRRIFLIWAGGIAGSRWCPALAAEVAGVAAQPYFAGVGRALEALGELRCARGCRRRPTNRSPGTTERQRRRRCCGEDSCPLHPAEFVAQPRGAVDSNIGERRKDADRAGVADVSHPSCESFVSRRRHKLSIGTERTWGPAPGKMMPSNGGLAQQAFIMDTLKRRRSSNRCGCWLNCMRP